MSFRGPIWQPEWDALLGTTQDVILARQFGVHPMTVKHHRGKLGIPAFAGKIEVRCHVCAQPTKKKRSYGENICPDCRREYLRRWHMAHREVRNGLRREWYLANTEHHKAKVREWAAAHPDMVRASRRRYARNERQRNAEVIASLPCLDCGIQHSPERRRAILRRMLPCLAQEVHEAWPCIWGEGGQANKSSAGSARLIRDLKAMGAVRQGDTWYPAAEVRSAA